MAGHINHLLKQAVATFGGMKEMFPKNFDKLKNSLDKIRGTDLGLHPDHPLFKSETWAKHGKAPVTYIDVYEDPTVSVGVFIVSENMKLPLHDHPHMHGLIKVIHGTLKISSFSVIEQLNEKQVDVQCHSATSVHYMDSPCVLEPHIQNLHEIESVNGVAAFLDILAPPYEVLVPELGERKCSYYKRVRQTGINKMLLEHMECPQWFWCDQFPYAGPPIEVQYVSHKQESENV